MKSRRSAASEERTGARPGRNRPAYPRMCAVLPRSLQPSLLLTALLLVSLLAPAAATELGKPAPPFSGKDERGKEHSLAQHKGQVVVLIVWASRCPHSKRYAARLRALAQRYRPKDDKERPKVVLLGLAPNKYETPELIRKAKGKLAFPILLDPKGGLTKQLKAFVTPTVFVLDGEGKLRYRGAIDDDPQGKKDEQKRTDHLRLAIEAVLAGKTPPKAKTGGPGFRIQF